jgi:hypothetical protein
MEKISTWKFFLLNIFVLLIFLLTAHVTSAYASSILFQDNFEDENADSWVPIRGDPTL